MRATISKAVVIATALVLVSGTGVAFAGPATTGSITGSVTVGSTALPDVDVYARDANGNVISHAVTDSLGEYAFPLLDPARYMLVFSKHGYATPLPGFAAARVTAGTNTANVDETLVPGASITGTVTDATNQPVAGAAIVALDQDALTALMGFTLLNGAGANLLISLYESIIPASITGQLAPSPGFTKSGVDGSFTVDGLRPGHYVIAANVDGHTGSPSQLVTIAAPGDAPTATLVLPAGATVHGKVTTADGKPIAGVEVLADSASTLLSIMSSAPTTFTDASGDYTLTGLASGNYSLTAGADGLASFDPQFVHISGPTDSFAVDFTGPGLGTISGTVLDEANAPVAGAQVDLFGGVGEGQATTGADGKYTVTGLPNDSYDVSVTADGFIYPADNTTDITASAQSATSDFSVVHGATVRGIVRTPEGDPIFGATILVRSSDPNVFGFGSDITLPDGSYELSGLDIATYTVTVEAPGYAAPPAATAVVASRGDVVTSDLALLPVTSATVPGKPRLQAVARPQSIQVMVVAPDNDGGNPITKYTVKAQPGNRACSAYYSITCTIPKLLDGTLYSVNVTATNEVGTGAAGISQVWTPAVPVVTSIKAKAGKKGQSVVSFKAPKTPNTIVDYKFEYKVKSSWKVYKHTKSRATTITIKGFAAKKAFSGRITTVLKSGRALTSKAFTFKTG